MKQEKTPQQKQQIATVLSITVAAVLLVVLLGALYFQTRGTVNDENPKTGSVFVFPSETEKSPENL